jgi:hypothetical protein
MVIKRTIESLRERPHDERMSFAGLVAIAVMVLLSGAWGTVFLGSLREATAQESSSHQKTADPFANRKDQAASVAVSVEDIIQSTITNDAGIRVPSNSDISIDDSVDVYPDSASGYAPSNSMTSPTQDSTAEVIRKLEESIRPY